MERRLIRLRSNQHRLGPACLCVQARNAPSSVSLRIRGLGSCSAGTADSSMAWNVEASQLDDQRTPPTRWPSCSPSGARRRSTPATSRGSVVSRSSGRAVTTPSAPPSPTLRTSPPLGWGVYRMHQQLIGVRRRHPWLHHARATPLHLTNTQLVYQAGTTGSDCLCPQPPGHRGGPAGPWCHRRRGPPTCTRSTTKTCVGGSTRTAGPSSPQGVRGAPAPRDPSRRPGAVPGGHGGGPVGVRGPAAGDRRGAARLPGRQPWLAALARRRGCTAAPATAPPQVTVGAVSGPFPQRVGDRTDARRPPSGRP